MPHKQLASDTQVMTSAGSSLAAWAIAWAEALGPIVDLLAGMVAIGAGILAMIWTAVKLYDRLKGK